jgi:hypothetical protein
MLLRIIFAAFSSWRVPAGTQESRAGINLISGRLGYGGRISQQKNTWHDFLTSRHDDDDKYEVVRRNVPIAKLVSASRRRLADGMTITPKRSSDITIFSNKRSTDSQPRALQHILWSTAFSPKRSSDLATFVLKRLSDTIMIFPKRHSDNRPYALKRSSDGVGNIVY